MPLDTHSELLKSIDINEFYKLCITSTSKRPDSRSYLDCRPLKCLPNILQNSNGSSMIRLGNTRVICSIKCQLAKPSLKSPSCGYIQPLVLLPRTQAYTSFGRRTQIINNNAVLSQTLLDIILKSNMLHLDDLCIEQGKWVWCVSCDLFCINNDGNLLDCCLLAIVHALKQTTLYTVKIDSDTGKPLVYTKEKLKLKLYDEPLCCTMFVYDNELIVDPTLNEEQVATTLIHVVLLKNDQICLLNKTGGTIFPTEKFQQCYGLAKQYIHSQRQILEKANDSKTVE
ncbi:unnamed protein product [Didymodactylos carnosus]|uniref:Ribosomal RNA-processing protein 43 n=1 Tax=Didymodactylos carnosus TaxID=1234261 RepID=A0A813RQN8_9BILA|nr:unnamed protein product [Didymodactylos carnosus]CAF0830866.1 unnamed protein product [Didymodactylos carnosus]CAF3568029.1 unnamed protein product [Didymodactylos carnosus]CAF3615417.1 unnamed protein product [Didymodactylos carnosus]